MTATLKEFVGQTLTDILDAVANARTHGRGAGIAPPDLLLVYRDQVGKNIAVVQNSQTGKPAGWMTFVEFDVAVTAETTDVMTGSGGFKIIVASAGVGGQVTERNQSTNRIQFSVPIHYGGGDTPSIDTEPLTLRGRAP
jgi:hypothetical protein